MKRIHLFEFEDLHWFPDFLRNYCTDFLQFLTNKTRMFHPILPLLSEVIKKDGSNQIIDLASGGGGALLGLNAALRKEFPELNIVLTDYFPNIPAFERAKVDVDNIDFSEKAIDARAVPQEYTGVRTQFLSFHHFRPEDAQKILQNAVDAKQPICIFEGQERSLASIVAMLLSPISVLLTTPLIRPFNWGRILFTYVLPLVPLFVLWDGVVSLFRTYSEEEMYELVDSLRNKESFDWQIGRLKSGPGYILYLIGESKA
jgi:hypothetical protein